MKKGCIIVLIVFLALGVIGYLKIRSFIKQIQDFAREFEEIQVIVEENTEKLNEKYPFTEPETITLSNAQVESFFAIRRVLHEVIGNTEFYQHIKKLEETEETEKKPSFSDLTTLFSSMSSSFKAITEQYFASLDQQQLSPGEYEYLSRVITSVLEIELNKGNFKEEIEADLSRQILQTMLNAEQMELPLYQCKREIQALDEAAYAELVKAIVPFAAEFNQLTTSFYFDKFKMDFQSELEQQSDSP
ncbi:MAG: hypothetical protein JXD22_13380 [Sedimentisphaerales bacterium]|nr:hypothetical protein [Sedimentisphaerales bacterium]